MAAAASSWQRRLLLATAVLLVVVVGVLSIFVPTQQLRVQAPDPLAISDVQRGIFFPRGNSRVFLNKGHELARPDEVYFGQYGEKAFDLISYKTKRRIPTATTTPQPPPPPSNGAAAAAPSSQINATRMLHNEQQQQWVAVFVERNEMLGRSLQIHHIAECHHVSYAYDVSGQVTNALVIGLGYACAAYMVDTLLRWCQRRQATAAAYKASRRQIQDYIDKHCVPPEAAKNPFNATQCVFCMGGWNSATAATAKCELQCGHVMHRDCLAEYFLEKKRDSPYRFVDLDCPIGNRPLDLRWYDFCHRADVQAARGEKLDDLLTEYHHLND